jgi:hypothetical protein
MEALLLKRPSVESRGVLARPELLHRRISIGSNAVDALDSSSMQMQGTEAGVSVGDDDVSGASGIRLPFFLQTATLLRRSRPIVGPWGRITATSRAERPVFRHEAMNCSSIRGR